MKKILMLAVVIGLLVGGCATMQLDFAKKDNQTDEEFYLVKQYCKSNQAVLWYPFSNIVDSARYGDRFNRCMQKKGYVKK